MKTGIRTLSLTRGFPSLVGGTEVTTFQENVSRAVTGPLRILCEYRGHISAVMSLAVSALISQVSGTDYIV